MRILVILFVTVLFSSLPVQGFAMPGVGSPAPRFRTVTTSGQKVSLETYRGQVLLIEFFATWCGGCNESMPHLIKLRKQYGTQGLQVLGLNPGVRGDTADVVRRYALRKQIDFPVALVDDDVLLKYGVQPIPAIFIIDRKGLIAQRYVGFAPATLAAMETTIRDLLDR